MVKDPLVELRGTSNGALGTLALGSRELSTGLLVLGGSGVGKTNVIMEIARQLKRRMGPNDTAIVFDPKGDYKASLFDPSRDLSVSSFEKTNPWNICGEVAADGWVRDKIIDNAREISKTVFCEAIERSASPFFPQAAREVFSSVLAAVVCCGIDDPGFRHYLNNDALKRYLTNLDAPRLREFISTMPDLSGCLKYVGGGASDQALGVFAELQLAVESLFCGAYGEAGPLSVRCLQRHGGGSWLFLGYDVSKTSSSAPSVIVDTYLKEALSRSASSGGGRRFVIVDELRRLPGLQLMENALSFGRSQGLNIIAGLQDVQQLESVYGGARREAGSVLSGFRSVVAFRSESESTRRYVSEMSGRNVQEVTYLSARDGKSWSELREGMVVEDWEIATLERGEAVVTLPYGCPFRFSFGRY